MNVQWTRRALRDLADIDAHISTENPAAGDAFRLRAVTYVNTKVASHPMIGRPGRVQGTRESVIHSSYIVVYRVTADGIEVLTVRHAARRWPTVF